MENYRGNPKIEMTEEQRTFLQDNFENMTLLEIGNHFGVSQYQVQCWMNEAGLKKVKRVRKVGELCFADKNGNFVWDKNLATI